MTTFVDAVFLCECCSFIVFFYSLALFSTWMDAIFLSLLLAPSLFPQADLQLKVAADG